MAESKVSSPAQQNRAGLHNFSILIAKSERLDGLIWSRSLTEQGYKVVGVTTDINDLLHQLVVKKPTCLLIESGLSGSLVSGLVEQIRSANALVKLILYLQEPNLRLVANTLQADFAGFVYATDGVDELYSCFSSIHSGNPYYSQGFADVLKNFGLTILSEKTKAELNALTRRERDILKLVAGGYGLIAIGEKLVITARTVANHKRNLAARLGLSGARQVAQYASSVREYL